MFYILYYTCEFFACQYFQEVFMKFNERLKELRLNSSFLQKELASFIGVSIRTFQDYERGNTEPNIEKLIKLADIFNVTLDYLMGRDINSNPFPEADVAESQTNPPINPNE